MIRLENSEFEKEILEGGSCIAVPVQISRTNDGETEILTYSFCHDIAEEFEKKYNDDPFAAQAVEFLREKLAPIMEQLDYCTNGAENHGYYEYRCEKPNCAKILPECGIIDTLDGEEWDDLELDGFALDPTEPTDRMAVIREAGEGGNAGKIVCYAGLNDLSEDDGLYELTVECEEDCRGRGYATSCAAKLTEYLISLGEGVKYICSVDHLISQKTAEAAGFTVYKKVLPFVCYRNDDENENDQLGED